MKPLEYKHATEYNIQELCTTHSALLVTTGRVKCFAAHGIYLLTSPVTEARAQWWSNRFNHLPGKELGCKHCPMKYCFVADVALQQPVLCSNCCFETTIAWYFTTTIILFPAHITLSMIWWKIGCNSFAAPLVSSLGRWTLLPPITGTCFGSCAIFLTLTTPWSVCKTIERKKKASSCLICWWWIYIKFAVILITSDHVDDWEKDWISNICEAMTKDALVKQWTEVIFSFFKGYSLFV